VNTGACERIVVLNKRDLVPQWGMEVGLFGHNGTSKSLNTALIEKPFRNAMAKKFPHQQMLFASWQRPRDIRNLSEILVSMLLFLNVKESTVNARLSWILINLGTCRYSETPSTCYGAQRLGHWNAECR
jgi:hypothetical protein